MSPATSGPVPGLEGEPEGSGSTPTTVPRWALPVAVVFGLYLLFRIVQGVTWLAHHI
ncbi:MAG: hypothetical protein ACYDB7_06705 [Mycobacteriales bacterium]